MNLGEERAYLQGSSVQITGDQGALIIKVDLGRDGAIERVLNGIVASAYVCAWVEVHLRDPRGRILGYFAEGSPLEICGDAAVSGMPSARESLRAQLQEWISERVRA